MKLNERGRAKYRPMKNIDITSIQKLLQEKISEEEKHAQENGFSLDLNSISYLDGKMNLISLFSGCGGLDLGTEIAGLDAKYDYNFVNDLIKSRDEFNKYRHQSIFHTILSIDNFKEANETYNKNFSDSILQGQYDIRKIKEFPKAEIILGGFPCPGFSEGGPRLIDDERNFLYVHFIRALLQSKPLFFIAENVKGMLTLGKGAVANQIKQDFESAGYKVKMQLVNSRDFGVPQLRERVFLVGVRNDIPFDYEFPTPTHGVGLNLKPYVTLQNSIGDLTNDPGDYYTGGFSSMYLSRNRKKKWDDQSFTIQASGRQAPLHPSGDPMIKIGKDHWELPGDIDSHRRLSVKEIARIQTFPDWFEFSCGKNTTGSNNNKINKIYKQIGNAVPVELARAILKPIADWAYENQEKLNDYIK